MGRLTIIAVLTLLYLQWSDAATPIPAGKEYVYTYNGAVETLNSEHDHLTSQWNISAKLIMQSVGDDIVIKFDDVKTSLFAGYQADKDVDSGKVLPIPEEAHKLYLPFVVHYHENGTATSLSHQPDEPLWSLNMKRAIASIMQIDTSNVELLDEHKFFEQNIYGNCEVEYSVKGHDSGKIVSKTINVDSELASWSSAVGTGAMPEGFNPVTTTAARTYHFVQTDGTSLLKQIDSNANITYRTMHSERSGLKMAQSQVFELLSESAISKPIDVAKNTESTTLIYFDDTNDETSGRKPKKTVDPEKLLNELQGYYKEFKADFHKYPLTPGDLGVNNSLISMWSALSQMDADTLDITVLGVLLSDDEEAQSIFISQLPYVGTNETLRLIQTALESDSLNDLVAIKLMATFPKYVNNYTEDLLKRMDVLMNLKEAENKQVKYAGILCFASMVAEIYDRAEVDLNLLEEYSGKYKKHFEDATDYEDKMTYLLGLINMGKVVDTNVMISIIKDKDLSHHMRSLAAYGFKPYLSSHWQEVFKQLWPLVKNHAEHFEVRVAILDVLMSLSLSEKEFNMIIEEFSKESDDQVEQHLQNYLSTTLDSLQNTTMYKDHLGELATASAVSVPSYYDTWSTGNYRIGYTDSVPNFGSYFQARLVANPITNIVNVIQLSYNQFAMSMNLGTYTAYIKLEGVADYLFVDYVLGDRPNYDLAIPQLVELLKKFNYKLVENLDMHIEVVLFCDDRVVFGMHINKGNIDKYNDNPLFQDLLKLLVDYESVTHPKFSSKNLVTDLGTHAETFVIETDVVSHKLTTDLDKLFDDSEIKNVEFNYRSSRYESVSLESYNPLMDVSINVYKYKSNAKRIYLPVALNVTGEYFTFDNINDSINLMRDATLGVSVDDPEKLALFGNCEANIELTMGDQRQEVMKLEEFGIGFNYTTTSITTASGGITTFFQLLNSYQSNSVAIPVAEPVLFVLYLLDFNRYLATELESVSIRSKAILEEPTETMWEWDFDIDDVYNENDPINGTQLTVTSRISCRRKHDAKILSSMGIEYSYTDAAKSHGKSSVSHVEQMHKLRADYSDDDTHYIACLDREIMYPNRRADKWSINPVEPAKGKGRFSVGTTDKTKACSNDYSITFSDIFEPAENLMDTVKNMKEYKTCKKDSAGLKYIPPTDACYAVHDAVSKYNNYTLYLDLKNAGKLSKVDKALRTSDRGFKFFELYYVDNDLAHYTLSKEFLDAVATETEAAEGVLDRDISLGIFSGIEDPTTIAYNDYDAVVGISSTCDITPSEVNTLTGEAIKNYESKDGKEVVAFVECIDETRSGMTIQKFSDKKIGFTMWSGNDTLITSVAGDKLKVVLNGDDLHEQSISNPYFKVYFLADDVLYITNQIVEVYYNTEYVSIKSPSLYNNYICGLCAHVNKFNTDNQVN